MADDPNNETTTAAPHDANGTKETTTTKMEVEEPSKDPKENNNDDEDVKVAADDDDKAEDDSEKHNEASQDDGTKDNTSQEVKESKEEDAKVTDAKEEDVNMTDATIKENETAVQENEELLEGDESNELSSSKQTEETKEEEEEAEEEEEEAEEEEEEEEETNDTEAAAAAVKEEKEEEESKEEEDAIMDNDNDNHEDANASKKADDPYIGTAVERSKLLPSGYSYPLQGKVVAYQEPKGRIPARWSVNWETTEAVVLQDEWVVSDLVAATEQQQQEPTLLLPPTTKRALEVIQSRHQQNLDHALGSNQLVSSLLLYAAMEEALQLSLHQQDNNASQNTTTTKGAHPHPPLYYAANPSSYLQPPTATDTTPSYRASKLQMTPTNLAQRVRTGSQWAWNYLVAQQPPAPPPPLLVSATSARRSLRQPKPVAVPQVPKPTPVQRGGRVAMWWLDELEKEKEKKQNTKKEVEVKAKNAETKPPKETKESSSLTDPPETTTIEEAAKEESSMPDAMDDDVDADADVESEASEAKNNTNDDDDDYNSKEAEGDEEDDDDEELEGVEKERKGNLSPVPEPNDDDDDDDDEDEDTDAVTFGNPYLKPSFPALLEYLAKPKSLTGQDVQTALCESVLRIKHNRRSSNHGLVTSSLSSVDQVVLDQETPDYPPGKLVVTCVSGESYAELLKLDPHTFSRCKFSLDVIGDQEQSQQVQRTQELLLQEVEFKAQKVWDKWRHRGIHEGYAVWPNWHDAIGEWVKGNCESAESAAAVPTYATTTTTTTNTNTNTNDNDEEKANNNDDEALAKSLEETEAFASSGRRSRSTRRARTSGANSEGGGGGGVFYGNHSQLTQKQLMDALVRLVKANQDQFQTMMRLQDMVAEDSNDPIRRCRIALGKLVWKRNQLIRKSINSELSDSKLATRLFQKPLVTIQQPVPVVVPVVVPADNTENAAGDNKAEPDKKELSEEEKGLVQYIQALHSTELQLRRLVLKHLTEIPVAIVATAADERSGAMESMDAADFEDPSSIEWHSSGHDLINKLIYRPSDSKATVDMADCRWYTIRDYSKSIESEGDSDEPLSVERRMRFRAEPAPAPGASYVEPGETLLLTEAQVHAGFKAGELETQQSASKSKSSSGNPFAGGSGGKISLVPVDMDEEMEDGSSSKEAPIEILARIIGHDNVIDEDDGTTVEYRILVSPEPDSSGQGEAFWATLDVRADDSSYVCQPVGDSTTWYSIGIFDYHQSSAAFRECQNIVNYLRRSKAAGPFMEPVDPVALNVPSYPEIVKNPMDITTLAENLENEHYSRIPPGQSVGHTPVSRMLNGPFRKDIGLIFDNAMLFNPPDDWIHKAAAQLKKNVLKKIADVSYAADQKSSGSGRIRQKNSVYVDEDSDVDMYEYESDQDEEFDTGGRQRSRKRKRASRGSTNKDDFSSRAIEHTIRLQSTLRPDLDLRGPFANLPLNADASSFALSPEWSCRRSTATAEVKENDESASQKRAQEMAELLELQRVVEESEAAGLRRSTRAHHEPSARGSSSASSRSRKGAVEFFLKDGSLEDDNNNNNNSMLACLPSSRLEVEVQKEKRHEEYYSKLYQTYSNLMTSSSHEDEDDSESSSSFGLYANGSFPPYLGRVVPITSPTEVSWETRAPFVVPALRWVLRGLIHSGHLTAVEPLTTDLSSGVIMTNDIYYWDAKVQPIEVLDLKELQRKKRSTKMLADDESEEDIELSEYETLRAERVARNAERLKALGLA